MILFLTDFNKFIFDHFTLFMGVIERSDFTMKTNVNDDEFLTDFNKFKPSGSWHVLNF